MHAVRQHNVLRDILAGIALTLILLVFEIVTTWLIPLPALYYRIKLGRNTGMIIPAVVILIVMLAGKGITSGVVILSGWMFLGFILGECFQRGLTIEKTVLMSSATVFLLGCLALFFYSNLSHTGIYDLAFTQVKTSLGYLVSSGLIEEAPDPVLHRVTRMLPGMIGTMVLLIAWLNTVIGLGLLKRNDIPAPDFGELDMWKVPEPFVWVAIIGTAGFLSGSEPVSTVCTNIMWVVFLIYFFQGISIVSFYIKKTKIPVILRYLLYWLIFFQFPVNLLVAGAGLFDMWVDFRKLGTKLTGSTSE